MVRSSARKATQKGVALAQGCETAEASYDARIWAEWRGDLGGAAQGHGWGGAEGTSELRGNDDGGNKKTPCSRVEHGVFKR